MVYSNANIEKRLWIKISMGISKEELILSGKYNFEDIKLFFAEYANLIEKYHKKQKLIEDEVNEKIKEEKEQFKSDWKRSKANTLFQCPRCYKKLKRNELKSHLDEFHPFPDPPPVNVKSRVFKEWYYDYLLQQAKLNYIKKLIRYYPPGGQPK